MGLRTDLVSECDAQSKNSLEYEIDGCRVIKTVISSNELEKKLSKPKGCYYTLKFQSLDTVTDVNGIKRALISALDALLPKACRESIMIVGLGNSDITPDALGPETARRIIATRHIGSELKNKLGLTGLKSVSSVTPGVIGKTGIETCESIAAAVRLTRPSAVIAIDALAASSTDNLCRTIQMCNSGISPGSGVNNSRKELSLKTLGVPVIAIGVPTVTDSPTPDMMVTPKDIDILITKASELIAGALNIFMQPHISEEIIAALS